jgi:hypothetical protein
MTPFFSIRETAETEINEAAAFYDLENPGLGSVFINEIQKAIERMAAQQSVGSGRAASGRGYSPAAGDLAGMTTPPRRDTRDRGGLASRDRRGLAAATHESRTPTA